MVVWAYRRSHVDTRRDLKTPRAPGNSDGFQWAQPSDMGTGMGPLSTVYRLVPYFAQFFTRRICSLSDTNHTSVPCKSWFLNMGLDKNCVTQLLMILWLCTASLDHCHSCIQDSRAKTGGVCESEVGWDPLLQCLHLPLDKHLLPQQDTNSL